MLLTTTKATGSINLDIATLWDVATDQERRTLVDELVDTLKVHPGHLVVAVHGAPLLNVAFAEVGLKAAHSENGGVGGGT